MFSPRSKGVLRVVAALALLVAVFSTTNVTWAGSPVQSGVSGNTAARPLMQGASGFIQLNCQLNNSGGVNITVTFNRPGPPPSNIIVTLTLLDGSTETQTFANTNSLSFSGTYANIDVQATWPDGATGYATGDCSSSYPTPTPIPPTLTPTVTNTPGPTNTPRPTNTPTPTLGPGEPTLTPRPTNTPRPTVTPGGPTLTPEPASPTPDTSINITIDCDYFSDTDRQFIVTLVPRAAGPPSGTAILALVGGGFETQTFTTNSVTYRGAYLGIRVNVSWPDGASATGGNTCGLQIPNPQIPPTVTPPATPTTDVATATPPPASTPTSPPPPPPPAETTPTPETPPPAETTPTSPPPRPPEEDTPTPETPPPAETTPTPTLPVTDTPATAVPPPTAPPATAVPPPPTTAPPPTSAPRPTNTAGGSVSDDEAGDQVQRPAALLPETAVSGARVLGGLGVALLAVALGAALRRRSGGKR